MTVKIHLPQQNPLLDAEQILLTDGWITGSMKCGTGERCAVGALRAACGMREHNPAARKRLSKAYVQSLHLLAAAINPHYKGCREMRPEIRDATRNYDRDVPTAKFDDLTAEQQVEALESYIIQYNDGRVDNQKGRNAVLRKFAKAATAFAAV